jgi:hypothetical protein
LDGDKLAALAPSVIDILTADEAMAVERAFGFLQHCARLVGIPHAEWWQLDYHTGAASPWRVIDVGAQHDPTGTSHTVITLRFGDWRFSQPGQHRQDPPPGNPRPPNRAGGPRLHPARRVGAARTRLHHGPHGAFASDATSTQPAHRPGLDSTVDLPSIRPAAETTLRPPFVTWP